MEKSEKPVDTVARVSSSLVDEKADYHSQSDDNNGFIEGSEGVTQSEFDTLRQVPDKLPYAAFMVVIVEFAERWTYYGTTNVYNNFIRAPLPPGSTTGAVDAAHRAGGVAGALGLGVQKSTAVRNFNTFWVYVTPFLGGIIADCWWGRYNTIAFFSVVCLIGHIILVGSASPGALAHPQGALAGLIVAIVVMGVGAGCIKANVSPMIAEQYQGKLRKTTLKSGEVVLLSPALTYQRIYLYFYAAINLGSVGAISASFIARDHGYWATFLVPTCIFLLVPAVLWFGRKSYVITPPRGSIILECARVFKIAAAARWSWNPWAIYFNFKKPGFWDVAKPSHYAGGAVPTNITWDDEFVGETMRTFNACKVFLWFPFFWLAYSQIDGNLGTVAAGMTLNGTPNDLIQNLNPITLIVFIPIFDQLIYPGLRKLGINYTPIKRIYTGFLVAGLAMVYAAVLQKFLYQTSPCHDNQPSACVDADKYPLPSPLNVWIVSGPYILVGIAEIFASITSLEYAFTKAPKQMKGFVAAFSQFQTAISAALNFALVAVNVEQKFTWLFGSFAIMAWITGTLFYLTFRNLDKQEAALNTIGTGDREGMVGKPEHPV